MEGGKEGPAQPTHPTTRWARTTGASIGLHSRVLPGRGVAWAGPPSIPFHASTHHHARRQISPTNPPTHRPTPCHRQQRGQGTAVHHPGPPTPLGREHPAASGTHVPLVVFSQEDRKEGQGGGGGGGKEKGKHMYSSPTQMTGGRPGLRAEVRQDHARTSRLHKR